MMNRMPVFEVGYVNACLEPLKQVFQDSRVTVEQSVITIDCSSEDTFDELISRGADFASVLTEASIKKLAIKWGSRKITLPINRKSKGHFWDD